MRLILPIALILAVGCTQPPATFRPVDFPAEAKPEWVKSGPSGAALDRSALSADDAKGFAEEAPQLSVIRVAASPEDFYGSKLYDGFDFMLQPLDAANGVVKKLGRMTATLYRFEGDTLEGEGEPLMTWNVPASRMKTLWVETGVNRGYHMKLAWDRRPMVKDVKLDVRFETLDDRVFTKSISAGDADQPRYRWLDK